MNSNDLILIGGGGHCRSVIDVAECAGFHILGILDIPSEVGKTVMGYPIIGTDADIKNYVNRAKFIITVGQIKSNSIRKRIYNEIIRKGGELTTIISPDAYVSKHSSIGVGTVIMHKAFVNANCNVGDNCIINTMVNIEHDVVVGSHTHISTGSMINGGCIIGNDVFIGSQSVLSNQISVCDNVVVGAGTFVYKNILVSGIYSNVQNLKL